VQNKFIVTVKHFLSQRNCAFNNNDSKDNTKGKKLAELSLTTNRHLFCVHCLFVFDSFICKLYCLIIRWDSIRKTNENLKFLKYVCKDLFALSAYYANLFVVRDGWQDRNKSMNEPMKQTVYKETNWSDWGINWLIDWV
jgi:hypothetical protein